MFGSIPYSLCEQNDLSDNTKFKWFSLKMERYVKKHSPILMHRIVVYNCYNIAPTYSIKMQLIYIVFV
jgi:hypothetical protein